MPCPAGITSGWRPFWSRSARGIKAGQPAFLRLGLELTGKPGDGLFFVNTDARGQPEPAMWHAGLPVTRGRKLMLSKWIRDKPLDLAGPPGRPF